MFKKVKPCEFVDDCLKIKMLKKDFEKGNVDNQRLDRYYEVCMRESHGCSSKDFYLKYPALTELNSSKITYI